MDLNKKIIEDMIQLADNKYKEFHSSLCPNVDDILGVRIPELRKYAKELSKGDFRGYLDNALSNYYEERVLNGLVIGYAKMDLEEKFKYLDSFVPRINSWAVCDVSCSNIKVKKDEQEKLWEYILKYVNSENEFEVRFSVIMMLGNFITPEYIDRVLNILENIKNDKYYVKMAIAWTLCDCYIKQKEKTFEFLNVTQINDWTYNKAIQKMCESFRVTPEEKECLRKMKRK